MRRVPPRDAVQTTTVAAGDWRTACLDPEHGGGRFEGLFAAAREHDEVELRAVFSSGSGTRMIVCRPPARTVDSIVEEIPAAAWDEREAADTHRLRFVGHEPLRPLLNHQAPLDAWAVPVTGRDTHQVAVGPVHAGVIESGHFRFHVVGERILHLDAQLFYKRRGLEAAAAGRPLKDAIAHAQRACGACAVANTVAYAHACETALGLYPDDQLRRGRTLLLELERVYNHLHDISAICAGVGFAPGTMGYAALKERAQRVNLLLTGHRFLFGSVSVASSALSVGREKIDQARGELRELGEEHAIIWRQLQFVSSLQNRLGDVGTLSREDAQRLGTVGPAARASGLRQDVRGDSPRLSYGGFDPVVAQPSKGDVASRMAQRAIELEQSLALLDELLTSPLLPGEATPVVDDDPGGRFGLGRVESPRGRTVCLIEHELEQLRALHLRTGSYANWPVLAHAVAGNLLPEFPLINKSFELCYACVDR